jgi:putative peptidoglycan lipid II flippase
MATSVSSTMTASAVLIAVLSFASRLLGLARDRVLAGTFGAGATLDMYYTAFRIPDLLFNLLGLAAFSAAFLPLFVRLRGKRPERAWEYAAQVCSDVVIALVVLCVVGILGAPLLFRFLAPGFDAVQLAGTVQFGRVLFLATFFLGCSTVFGSILQAEKRFLAFAAAPLFYNLGIIIGVVAIVPFFGALGIVWGVVLGAFAHFAIQAMSAMRAGFRFRWRPTWRDADVRETIRLLIPRMLGLSSAQVQLVVITGIASTLASGTLTAFTFAQNIYAVPLSLVGVSFAIAAFPLLSESVSQGDTVAFRRHLSTAIRQIALLAFPAVVLLLTLKAQIVRVLLGTGAFGWSDTVRTLYALEALGVGLLWAMLVPVLARAFYAFSDTVTPFVIGLVADVVAIGGALVLAGRYGARGLALAVAFAGILQATLLLFALRKHIQYFDGGRTIHAIGKFSLAALIMGITVQLIKPGIASYLGTDTFVGIFLQGLTASMLGLGIYLIVGVLLKSEDITALARALHRRVFRSASLYTGGVEEVQG